MKIERAAAPAGRPYLLPVLGAVALLLGAAATIYHVAFPQGLRAAAYASAVERGYGAHGIEPAGRSALLSASRRWVDDLRDPPDLPTLVIDIKFKHLQKLYERRQEALRTGFLIQEEGDFVPASIRLGARTIPVRLRLKGDMLDHLRTDKWSFRIHTRGGEEILGLRRFSVQSPDTRGFQAEVLFLETLRRFGVLAPRYLFAKVVVNGNDVGVMAVEEHFAKELLERSGRKDGVIIRFDESLLWDSRVAKGERNQRSGGPFESHVTAPIDAFEMTRIRETEHLSRELEVAAGLLRAFVDGKMPASEVFDAELLGRYLAVAEAWEAWHAVVWPNMRFYLNPLTMRLEPIGFDADIREALSVGTTAIGERTIAEQMLDDPAVRAAFDRTLQDIRDSIDKGDLITHLRRVESSALRALRSEYVFLEDMVLELFARRVRSLPLPLHQNPPPTPYPVHVLAELVRDGPRTYLEIANPLPEEITIRAIEWVGAAGNGTPFETQGRLSLPLVLPPTPVDTRPSTLQFDYRLDPAETPRSLRLTTSVAGSGDVKVQSARRGFPALRSPPLPTSTIATALGRHPFLSITDGSNVAVVRKGRWTVAGSLVIPRGYSLRVEAGTTLRFQPSEALVVHGATDLRGTAQEPIVFEPASADAGWQGVVVHEAAERSQWSHVAVRGTTGVTRGAWSLTGGITFYRSDVTMSQCTLVGNKAEDALNIVHSDFALEELTVLDTASDGFDSDFATGRVERSTFRNIGSGGGADAIDVSGSSVTVERTKFSEVTDKALSVGESSTLTATDVLMDSCGVGAVSKDGSMLRLTGAQVRGARVAGLMTYTKKSEYGPARLIAEKVQFVDVERRVVAQIGSSMMVDGKRVAGRNIDVDQLYRTVMKPQGRQ